MGGPYVYTPAERESQAVSSPDPGSSLVEPAPVDRPLAGPALATMGGLVLFLVALLAYSSSNPYFASSTPAYVRASLFVAVGPALGPIVAGLGMLSYLWPRHRLLLGSTIVPLAVLGTFSGAAGGLFVGPILALAGGLLIIAYESKDYGSAVADERGWAGWMRRNYAIIPCAFIVAGVVLAVGAPSLVSVGCPASPCLPTGGGCPTIGVGYCGGPTLWVVFLVSAVFTAPMAFRVRAIASGRPMPA
jgi:uncharacterized protein DUF6114